MGNLGTKHTGGSKEQEFLNHKNDSDFEFRNGKVYIKDENAKGLIAFYAPWCHFCKELAPTWNEYSEKMGSSRFKFLAVDCTNQKSSKVTDALGIQGFPTIKYIDPVTREIVSTDSKDGSKLNRSREGLRDFLKSKGLLRGR